MQIAVRFCMLLFLLATILAACPGIPSVGIESCHTCFVASKTLGEMAALECPSEAPCIYKMHHHPAAVQSGRCIFPAYANMTGAQLQTMALPRLPSNSTLYLLGDSTMRQILHALLRRLALVRVNYTEIEFAGFVRTTCLDWSSSLLLRRHHYVASINDDAHCGQNEVLCDFNYKSTAMGDNLNLQYNWGHTIYDFMTRELLTNWERAGPTNCTTDAAHPSNCPPDYLILGPGLHDCYHDPFGIGSHLQNLQDLADHLARMRAKTNTTIIWLDVNPFENSRRNTPAATLSCVYIVNQEIWRLAAKHHIPMFSRHTLVFGSSVHKKLDIHQDKEFMDELVSKLLAYIATCV
jgi:hypothetical protein